jgi:hypothetical protein
MPQRDPTQPCFRPARPDDTEQVAALRAASWRRHYRDADAASFLDGDVRADRQAVRSSRLAAPTGGVTVLAEDDAGASWGSCT